MIILMYTDSGILCIIYKMKDIRYWIGLILGAAVISSLVSNVIAMALTCIAWAIFLAWLADD